MKVYLCIPSKKPAAEAERVLSRWIAQGYGLAIWRDVGDEPVECDILIEGNYPGYAVACNKLIASVLQADPEAEWFVCAGDDILPDPNKPADEIADECAAHFHGTFGVMQPTGDDWSDAHGRMIERIAGSPFIGREFARRVNQGRGPYWEEYRHCFLDNELMDVAKKLGVFQQRPDLKHLHQHWTREKREMPEYLAEANSPAHWQRYSRVYFERKAAGFPGAAPVEVLV